MWSKSARVGQVHDPDPIRYAMELVHIYLFEDAFRITSCISICLVPVEHFQVSSDFSILLICIQWVLNGWSVFRSNLNKPSDRSGIHLESLELELMLVHKKIISNIYVFGNGSDFERKLLLTLNLYCPRCTHCSHLLPRNEIESV